MATAATNTFKKSQPEKATFFTTRTAAASKHGTTPDQYTGLVKNGMKYDRLGVRRGIMAGAYDREIIHENLERHRQGLGGGRGFLAYVDRDGKVIKDAVMNWGGRGYESKEGHFNIVDVGNLEYRKKIREEADESLIRLLEYSVEDIENLAEILNMTVDEANALCSPGGIKATSYDANPPRFIDEANCQPDYMQVLPSSSKEYALGISKLKFILRATTAILDYRNKAEAIVERNDIK